MFPRRDLMLMVSSSERAADCAAADAVVVAAAARAAVAAAAAAARWVNYLHRQLARLLSHPLERAAAPVWQTLHAKEHRYACSVIAMTRRLLNASPRQLQLWPTKDARWQTSLTEPVRIFEVFVPFKQLLYKLIHSTANSIISSIFLMFYVPRILLYGRISPVFVRRRSPVEFKIRIYLFSKTNTWGPKI